MAKKGKKGKGGKKKAAPDGVESDLTPAVLVVKYKNEAEVMKKINGHLRTKVQRLEQEKRDLWIMVNDSKSLIESKVNDTEGVRDEMTRSFKAMEFKMKQEMISQEEKSKEVRDQLTHASEEKEAQKKEFMDQIDAKQRTIDEYQLKMELMAKQFSAMLKKTLEKLTERIEVNSNDWDQQPETEEFKQQLIDQFNL